MNIVSRKVDLTGAELALIGLTRVALGVGAGLLLSSGFKRKAQRGAGVALLAFGLISTLPLALRIRDELK